MATDGSPPTPKSCERIPRLLTASMKLSWLLPVMPGVKEIRSFTSLRLTDCVKLPERAVIASGTSWTDSSRLVAVTTTSSISAAITGACKAVAMMAAETAVDTAVRCGRIMVCLLVLRVMESPNCRNTRRQAIVLLPNLPHVAVTPPALAAAVFHTVSSGRQSACGPFP